MNFKVILAAALLATSLTGVSATASYADGARNAAVGGLTTGQNGRVFAKPDGSYGGKNVATAFTNFCYAQFGPNAKYPDADLLQKCLSK